MPSLPNFRAGCVECDARPAEYFRRTGYSRGYVWHFDTAAELTHFLITVHPRDHPPTWSIAITPL